MNRSHYESIDVNQADMGIVELSKEYIKMTLKNVDASHDFDHIERVVALTQYLAKEEDFPVSLMERLILVAIFHDVADLKYTDGNIDNINGDCDNFRIKEENSMHHLKNAMDFLRHNNHPQEEICIIEEMIRRIGFKEELVGGKFREGIDLLQYPGLSIVMDADKLDAIGAIGIARCFSYAGAKGNKFYTQETLHKMKSSVGDKENKSGDFLQTLTGKCASDINTAESEKNSDTKLNSSESFIPKAKGIPNDLTKEDYVLRSSSLSDNSAVNHFYEKLLHLKNMMRTKAGVAIAEERSEFLLTFLERFYHEINGTR